MLDSFRSVARRLERLSPIPDSRAQDELAARIDFLRRVFGHQVLRQVERAFRGPLVAVVTGGTNVGKSEVFNALAGGRYSAPDPRAGMTRRPAVVGAVSGEPDILDPGFLPGYERSPLTDPEILKEPCGPKLVFHYATTATLGIVLIDSPDVDSHRTENLARAEHLLATADAVVFVTSPSKYNDEACVLFLKRALDLGRAAIVVFNFLGEEKEKVLADFRAAVPGAAALEVTEIERFPVGESIFEKISASVAGLQSRLERFGSGREERARNALAFVQREGKEVVEAILRDRDAVDGIRRRTQDSIAGARRRFEADLQSEKDPEVERVIGEVLHHFRVPVIDDILNAPSRAVQWVFRTLQGRESAEVEAESRARRRKERHRKKMGEIMDALRAGTLRAMAEGASDPLIASVLKRASAGGAGEAEVETAWEEGEPRLTAWRDSMREEMIEKIRRSPNLRFFLQASKALLQVGTGVLTGVLLGAPIAVDIATGSAVAKLTQFLLETFGNAYFEDKRRACIGLQLERFDSLANRFVLEPLDAALPTRPDRSELEILRREIDGLRL